MIADVMSEKTLELGWTPKRKLPDYIEMLKQNNWN